MGVDDRKVWANFRAHMVKEYERMLAEGTGPTVAQEGWGGAFNATEDPADEEDTASLLESVTRYAERATAAESDVSTLKSEMGELRAQMAAMMTGGLPPSQGAFFAPQGPPPAIQIPAANPNKKRKTPQAAAHRRWDGRSGIRSRVNNHGSHNRNGKHSSNHHGDTRRRHNNRTSRRSTHHTRTRRRCTRICYIASPVAMMWIIQATLAPTRSVDTSPTSPAIRHTCALERA